MLKGFTVSDVQSFLSVVRLCAPISTIIVDHLDFAWFMKKKEKRVLFKLTNLICTILYIFLYFSYKYT